MRWPASSAACFTQFRIACSETWFRYHNRSRYLDGLFFVGAGTHPGAGGPGVLSSAKVLDRVVPAPRTARATVIASIESVAVPA